MKDGLKYTLLIEKAPGNCANYVPDLPGRVATGSTREAVLAPIRVAVAIQIESLRERGEPVPEPPTTAL